WQNRTNSLPSLSVAVWDYHRAKFVRLVRARSFDGTGRLPVGTLSPNMFSNGSLRIRIHTHSRLAPHAASLWLEGIYLHPLTPHHLVNIHTAPTHALLPFCHHDPTSLVRAIQAIPPGGFSSFSQLLLSSPDIADCTPNNRSALSLHSDVFDIHLEVEILRKTGHKQQVLARTYAHRRIDRSLLRLNPLARPLVSHAP
ncbi:MAG: hypothetical protein N2595_05335, partial [bacterium]|nr:hypothetical protein [bacterium]